MKKIVKLGIVVYSLAFASAQAADFKCPVVESVRSSNVDFFCSDCVLTNAHIDFYENDNRHVLRCTYASINVPWSGTISDNKPGVQCSFADGSKDCTGNNETCVATCTQTTKKK